MEGIINCVAYAQGRRACELQIEEIPAALENEEGFVWLGLYEPDEAIMKRVQQAFGLHELAVEDAHHAHQRPKLETYGDSLFVVLHTAQVLDDGKVHFGETHIFAAPRYLVTVRHGASLTYSGVRTRCEACPERLRQGPGFVLYALMDFVVDNYFPIVQALEDELESLEEQMFQGASNRLAMERIYDLKREIMALRRGILPVTKICTQLMRFTGPLIPEDTRPYFRDIYDHALRINEVLDILREMVTTALQVNLSLESIRQNEVVKRLAGWGAILAVPTLVASVYGMNFRFMPELGWHYGYPTAVAATFTICVWLYRRLRRAGWL